MREQQEPVTQVLRLEDADLGFIFHLMGTFKVSSICQFHRMGM